MIASAGFENMKDDLTVRIPKLFKNIQDAMAKHQTTNSEKLKEKLRLIDSKDRNKILNKEASDLFITSGRSGGSTKSSRAKSKSNSQNRRSRKRKSSQRKRGRRMTNERNTPGGLNNSFFTSGVSESKNSLPALSAIYGNSFSNSNPFNKRNGSGLVSIDVNGKKKKAFNIEKVNRTMDVKMYEKNNSSSLVGPARNKDYSSKKSPNNAKRNLSMGSNMTYDERKSRDLNSSNSLGLETKMNLIKQSNASHYTGFGKHRYRLRSLVPKGRRSASRRKSSNSKKRGHKQKITSHYKQKFPFDNKMRKASEKKRQLQMRARLAKKLSGIKSNDDYKQEEEEEDIPTNEAADES